MNPPTTTPSKLWKKITPADAQLIALRVLAGESKSALGREYGISHQTVAHHCARAKETPCALSLALRDAATARRSGKPLAAAAALRRAADALARENTLFSGEGDASATRAALRDTAVALLHVDHAEARFAWKLARVAA
jgi:hypothetical protein